MSFWADCPKCEKLLRHVDLVTLDAGKYDVLAHCCPHCHVVLGTEISPLSVRAEVLAGVEELLERYRR